MKNQSSTEVKNKCELCGQETDWQCYVYVYVGIVTYICNNCRKDYEKILSGEINKYTQRG